MLLLLDNFERAIEESEAIGYLLDTCPQLTVLATSRIPLRLQVEQEFRVQPLALPESNAPHSARDVLEIPSTALFVRRTLLVKPEFSIDDEKATIIADVCLRLDGLPLAIELAAARMAHLPLAALRERLQHRLQLLTGGARDLPARQQRMRDTIAWSYDLLAPPDQMLLRQLSVFAGSWSLTAAEEVCGASEQIGASNVLNGTRTLVENSLIIPMDDASGEARYRMLDTIREYAEEQLVAASESDELRRRHSAYYLRMAEQAEPALQDREQQVWYPRLSQEHENLRTALDWLLLTGEAELALRLAGALWRFWQRHGDIREGRQWLEQGLAAAAPSVPEQVKAKALWGASWLAYHQGDYTRSKALSAEHLALAQEHHDALGMRNALTGLGMAALADGDYAEAVQALREALDACMPLGNIWHRATSFLNLGNATMLYGDLDEAAALFDEAMSLYRSRGDEVFVARAQQHLGYVALLRGAYPQAEALFTQSLQALSALGDQPGIADGLEAAAAICATVGKPQQAGRLIEAASVLRERIGVAPLSYLSAIWQPCVARAEAVLGEKDWQAARRQGRALSILEAVASVTVKGI